jgi:hypothetical protein
MPLQILVFCPEIFSGELKFFQFQKVKFSVLCPAIIIEGLVGYCIAGNAEACCCAGNF